MERQASTQEQLMTVPQIAEHLQVPVSWVYGKVATREIPHIHVGRYVRFRLTDVQAWLEGRSKAA